MEIDTNNLAARYHTLRIREHFAREIHSRNKMFECRRDAERDFQKGDIVFFKIIGFEHEKWELAPHIITFVLRGGQYGIKEGYVVFGIRPHGIDTEAIELPIFAKESLLSTPPTERE